MFATLLHRMIHAAIALKSSESREVLYRYGWSKQSGRNDLLSLRVTEVALPIHDSMI